EQSTRLRHEHRPSEGPGADRTAVASTHRPGGASLAWRKLARRTGGPGKAAAGLALRYRERTRITAAHGGAMVCTDRWPRARAGAVPRRSAGDQRSYCRPRETRVPRIDAAHTPLQSRQPASVGTDHANALAEPARCADLRGRGNQRAGP